MNINCISEINQVDQIDKSIFQKILYRDSTDKFKITKHRTGKYPAIITVSGFLTEDEDNYKKWENSILKLYPDQEWFHLEWNNKNLPPRLKRIVEKWEERIKRRNTTSGLTPIIYPTFPYWLINNWWHVAVRNSRHAGKLLAKRILKSRNKEYILIGHSLGARVIYNCLKQIGSNGEETNIKEVHLLGGAVNSRAKKWSKIQGTVKNGLHNYYSSKDLILKILYSAAMIDRFPIGLKQIDLPYFKNFDSTTEISGHTKFIQNFHKIKK
jgi:hypothetical protein